MSGVMQRTLAILERLAADVQGVPLAVLADELQMPRSAAHRLLVELADLGYVRQARDRGDYMLTTKLLSLALAHLKRSGIVDLCQPILERLAQSVGELARIGVVDVDHLTWVATAQGATSGLRYDPDAGIDARLSCTASGLCWLSTLKDEEALELLAHEGYARPGEFGPSAPTTPNAVLKHLRAGRKQGYVVACETYRAGINGVAVPVQVPGKGCVGILVVSGPNVRLTEARIAEILPQMQAAAAEIAGASGASPMFDRAYRRPDSALDRRHAA